MSRFVRNLAILAALAGIVALGATTAAHADLIITAAEDGGTATTLVDVVGTPGPFPGLNGSFSGTIGDFQITIQGGFATTNAAGALSQLLSSAVALTNTSGANHTLDLTVAGTGYTSPTAPPALKFSSSIGGTTVTGGAGNVLAFNAYVDPTNTPTTAGAFSNGLQTTPITEGSNTGWNTGQADSVISSLASPYAMLHTVDFSLDGGASLGYQASQSLTAVPEPGTVAMALTGLPILGLLWARRRRRA